MPRQSQPAAGEPVERKLRGREFLCDVEADRVLELVRTPIEGPHLEHEAFCLGASKDVLRQDLEVAGAALEAGHQDEYRVGRLRCPREPMSRIAGVVQAAAATAELQIGIAHV